MIWKILRTVFYIAVTLGVIGFALIWMACGGGGVWFLTIMIILIVFVFIKRIINIWKRNSNSDKKEKEPEYVFSTTNRKNKILVNYIRESLSEGLDSFKIKRNLKEEGGWSEDEIKVAFDLINK